MDELPRVVCEGVRYVPAWEIGIAVGIAFSIVFTGLTVILAFWMREGKDESAGSTARPRTLEANVTPRRKPVPRR